MNYGEHLSTLIAVIVGLAVTELLAGASRTLTRQKTEGFSWLPFAQALMIATITLIFWLASYAELASGKYLGTLAYTTQLIAPSLLYFAATRVFPPEQREGAPSVHEHAVANARDVYIPPALWMLSTMIGNVYFFWPNWRGTLVPNASCLFAATVLLVAAYTRRDWLRWTATIVVEVTILTFIVIYLGNQAGHA